MSALLLHLGNYEMQDTALLATNAMGGDTRDKDMCNLKPNGCWQSRRWAHTSQVRIQFGNQKAAPNLETDVLSQRRRENWECP